MSDIAGLPEDYAFSTEQLEQLRQQFADKLSSEDRKKFEQMPVGDQVEFSAEAMARYAAHSAKEGGETGDKSQGRAGQQGAGGGAKAGGGQSGAPLAAAGGGGAAGSSGGSDQIDKLEQEIEKLEQEVAELEAKASSDETAKEQLRSKRIELATKQDELAILQQQEQQGGGA